MDHTELTIGTSYHVKVPELSTEYAEYGEAEFTGTYQGHRFQANRGKRREDDPDIGASIFYLDGDPSKKAEVEDPHLAAGTVTPA